MEDLDIKLQPEEEEEEEQSDCSEVEQKPQSKKRKVDAWDDEAIAKHARTAVVAPNFAAIPLLRLQPDVRLVSKKDGVSYETYSLLLAAQSEVWDTALQQQQPEAKNQSITVIEMDWSSAAIGLLVHWTRHHTLPPRRLRQDSAMWSEALLLAHSYKMMQLQAELASRPSIQTATEAKNYYKLFCVVGEEKMMRRMRLWARMNPVECCQLIEVRSGDKQAAFFRDLLCSQLQGPSAARMLRQLAPAKRGV